ncbi:phospholipase D-like domain-containing protein [Ramlibacter sp. PS4R-6]|uniref:phospholipase D-like domain-containing protein n=1 Tax=Ramlibacter sp. PS4R-6 TaxID=3133438 RepID=UPI003096FB1F
MSILSEDLRPMSKKTRPWWPRPGAGAFLAVATVCALAAAVTACGTLPDTRFLSGRYEKQEANFQTAWGPLSQKKSAALVARLQAASGDLDILDRQTVLEQQIGGSPLVLGNQVTLLEDGPATYASMFAAIRSAQKRILVESYIFEDGEIGRTFAELLAQRQAAGVQVRIIYDSVGTFGTAQAFFDTLKAAGVEIVEFNPVNPLAAKDKAWAPNHRDHRKLMIIDGETAFLGGINISSVYSSGSSMRTRRAASPPVGWRDTDVRIEGPVVADFEALFETTWARQKGQPAPPPVSAAQRTQPRGSDVVRAIGSTPDDAYSLIYLTLISAIANAERRVYITNAYFVPDPQLVKALLDAAARGVDVRMVLPGQSDSPAAFHAGRSHYAQLLEGGVKIYERRGPPLHAKAAVVDGVWSCVGSSNLDWRSALDNDEVNAVVIGREFAGRMESAYARDIAASDALSAESWRHHPTRSRIKEWGARLLGPLL